MRLRTFRPRLGLRARAAAVALAALAPTFALSGKGQASSALPLPWGAWGHTIATRAVLAHLPPEMPSFFREAGAQLEYLAPEPDRWRSQSFREMDEAWKHDHYVDLERVPEGALDARDRFEFLEALHRAGIARPQREAGLLPFRIIEVYQRLVTQFALWRRTPAGPQQAFIEARVVHDAGILGHYVLDASQPHHTTIHFNGWAEGAPNPHGYTTSRDFHSRFESGFVEAHIGDEEVGARMAPEPRALDDVRGAVLAYIKESNGTVERLYQLEKEHGFTRGAAHPEAREFAVQRLLEGSEMLRALWWKAWLESGAVAARRGP